MRPSAGEFDSSGQLVHEIQLANSLLRMQSAMIVAWPMWQDKQLLKRYSMSIGAGIGLVAIVAAHFGNCSSACLQSQTDWKRSRVLCSI
jgi:hypothetical protein